MKQTRINSIAYIRCSTKKQSDAFSIVHQKSNINNYSDEHGYAISNYYFDNGISGQYIKNRPSMIDMLSKIKMDNSIEALIVESLDRLSRNLSDLISITNLCFKNGIKIISILNPIDKYPFPEQKFLINLYGTIAENQIATTKEAVENALSVKFKQGELLSKRLPFALKINKDGHIVPNCEQLPILKTIYQLCIHGYGYRKISKYLLNNFKLTMSIQQIKSILQNTRYTGVMKTNYGTNNTLFPQIISFKMFNDAQKKISNSFNPHKNDFSNDAFSKKIQCPICKHKLGITRTIIKNTNYDYYYCSVGRNGLGANHHNFSIRIDDIKNPITLYLRDIFSNNFFKNKLVDFIKSLLNEFLNKQSSSFNNKKHLIIKKFKNDEIGANQLSDELKKLKKLNQKNLYSITYHLADLTINRFISDLFKKCLINQSKTRFVCIMRSHSIIFERN